MHFLRGYRHLIKLNLFSFADDKGIDGEQEQELMKIMQKLFRIACSLLLILHMPLYPLIPMDMGNFSLSS